MVSVINDSGEELTDFSLINKEVTHFYTQLYKTREDVLLDINVNDILNNDTP